MTIEIESNVPIPESTSGRRLKYPFESLEVGDSFFVEGKEPAQVSGSKKHFSAKLGHRYICRTVTEDGVKGVRLWRVE